MKTFFNASALITAILAAFATLPLFQMSDAAEVGIAPVTFYPVEQGTPYVYISTLYPSGAASGSVTGPFLIAMQTNYAYGSIDGVPFATTASTDGKCNQPSDYGCYAYLLIEQLPSAAVGLQYGTLTLSDGTSSTIVSNVRPAGVIVSPISFEATTLPGSSSDPYRVSLTNVTAAAITIGTPSFIDLAGSNSGAAQLFSFGGNCAPSLAAAATCVIEVYYAPTMSADPSGFIQIPTGLGPIDVAFEAYNVTPPANLTVNPSFIDFDLDASGTSAVHTITITNTSSQITEGLSMSGPTPPSPCDPIYGTSCVNFISNDCRTIAPLATCQIKVNFLADPTQAFTAIGESAGHALSFFVEPFTTTGSGFLSIGYAAYPSPGPPSPAVIAVSPAILQFPATPFGQPSAPQSVTLTNVSSRTLAIAIPSVADFVADPSCLQLLPGTSCEIAVRFLPISGNPKAVGSLTITATDVADPTGLTAVQSQQLITVNGSSVPAASLASPFGGIVASLSFDSSTSLTVTNTSNVPLVFGSIYGNRNFYAGQVTIVDTTGCGASLAPGKSCTLVVNAHKCEDVDGECWLVLQTNALSSPDFYTFEGDEITDTHSKLMVDSSPVVFAQTPTGTQTASQIIHVNLLNYNLSQPESFDVVPVTDPDFVVDNQCPKVLVPVANDGSFTTSCEILVTFAPQSPGFHAGSLAYRSSLQGDSIILAGTGVAPTFSLQPTSLKFPSTSAGSSSAAQVVTVENSGSAAIAISGVAIAGGQADDFLFTNSCGTSLTAGASCTITVTFKPVSAGSKVAHIVITDGASGSPQTIALTGTGTAATALPSVGLSTNALTFSQQASGTSAAAQSVTITNTSTAKLTLSAITVTGPQADDYSLTTTCGTALAARASCTIGVTFKPVSAGTKQASITIADNASSSPQTVTLTGTGTVVSAVTVSAASLNFPKQATGTGSNAQTVTLTNRGATTLGVSSITVTGPQADDYAFTTTCGTAVSAGASCTIAVTFKPVSAGTKHASITIADNASGSPQSVTLIGTGT